MTTIQVHLALEMQVKCHALLSELRTEVEARGSWLPGQRGLYTSLVKLSRDLTSQYGQTRSGFWLDQSVLEVYANLLEKDMLPR